MPKIWGANRALAIADLPFTGTANNNSFARGDGTWTNGVSSGGWTAGFFGGASSSTAVVVRNYTNDGSDNLSAQIAAGGAGITVGSTQTRGSGFICYGNESSGAGNAYICLGAVVGSTFRVYDEDGTNIFQVTKTGTSASVLAASGRIFTTSSSGVTANLFRNYSGTTLAAYVDSVDGADNGNLTLSTGPPIAPGSSQTRGAAIEVAGNEHTRPGILSLMAGSTGSINKYDANANLRQAIDNNGTTVWSAVVSVTTSFTTVRSLSGNQLLLFATVTGKGTILLEWDGTTLTKLAGAASLVVAGSAGAGETAFRASGGNLQAIVDTGTRNVSAGFAVRH